jgi:uncharacterized protein
MRPWSARRRGAFVAATVVVALVVGWVASPWGPTRSAALPSEPVVLATGSSGGLTHRYGVALAEAAGDQIGALRPQSTAGSRESLDLLRDGEAAFALATADVVEEYLTTDPDGGASIRAVARLYDSYLHLVVAADSAVHRLADLRGRRVAVGTLGSGTPLLVHRLLIAAGIDPSIELTWFEISPRAAVGALATSTIDAFFYVDGLGAPELVRWTDAGTLRFVDLADAAADLPAARSCPATACAVYRAGTMPAGTYPGLAVALTTVAVPTLLLTSAHAGDDAVRRLTGLVFDSAAPIADAIPAARQIDRHAAIFTGAVPLHPGARTYYRTTKVAA